MQTLRTGRIVQFDEARGYGFITPDQGGEDVFLHVNMLGNDRWSVAPGMPVEFESVEGDRGPKALTARLLLDQAPAGLSRGTGTAVLPARPPAVSRTVPAPAPATPAVTATASTAPAGEEIDEGMCDVLPERSLLAEITEALLGSMPDLTAAQVVTLRREMLTLARRHGWVED